MEWQGIDRWVILLSVFTTQSGNAVCVIRQGLVRCFASAYNHSSVESQFYAPVASKPPGGVGALKTEVEKVSL
jgi:hypothetical protein